MPEVTLQLFDVDPALRERFYREMIANGARSIDPDTIGVTIDSFADCDKVGAQAATLIPAAGHREPFKLHLAGPGASATIARMAVPGEEAEILANWLATNAGLQ